MREPQLGQGRQGCTQVSGSTKQAHTLDYKMQNREAPSFLYPGIPRNLGEPPQHRAWEEGGEGKERKEANTGFVIKLPLGQLQLSPAEDLWEHGRVHLRVLPLQGETAGVFKYQPSSGNGRGLLLGEEGAINSLST